MLKPRHHPHATRLALALAAGLLLAPAAGRAAAPRDELLRLVPADVSFGFLAQGLRAKAKALQDSPFAVQFAAMPAGKALLSSPELVKFATAEAKMFDALKVSAAQLRDEVFGDAIVFAYRAGPPGRPNEEMGIILTWARDPQLLAALLERLTEIQKKSGEVSEVREVEYQGRTYFRRVKPKAKDGDEFYFLRGNVLAFSGQEAMIRAAIDLDKSAPPAEKEVPPLAQNLRKLAVERAIMVWWLNPRSFDAALGQRAKSADTKAERAFLDEFLAYWKALDGAALFTSLDGELELGLSVRLRREDLPPNARQLLKSAGQPSALWQVIPEDALFAVAGRVEVVAFVQSLAGFLAPDARQALRTAVETKLAPVFGRDALPSLAAGLGPDWAFWMMHPHTQAEGWFPQLMAAVRIRAGADGTAAEEAFINALSFAAWLVRYRHPQIALKKAVQDKTEIRFLSNDKGFPPGFRPAYAVKGGYLLLSGSPETIRRFTPPANVAPKETAEVPLLRISFAEWRKYLKANRKPVVDFLASGNGAKPDEVGRKLDTLLANLEGFDRLEIAERVHPDQATIVFRLKTAQPLRK